MQRQGPSWSLLDGQVGSRPVSQAKEDGISAAGTVESGTVLFLDTLA